MPYVQRDDNGSVKGTFNVPQEDASEFLLDNDAEVISFLAEKTPLLARLSTIVSQLDDSVQAQFGGVIAPAYVALQSNKPSVAKLIIQGAMVPQELIPVKNALLAEFDE